MSLSSAIKSISITDAGIWFKRIYSNKFCINIHTVQFMNGDSERSRMAYTNLSPLKDKLQSPGDMIAIVIM